MFLAAGLTVFRQNRLEGRAGKTVCAEYCQQPAARWVNWRAVGSALKLRPRSPARLSIQAKDHKYELSKRQSE